jgi:hypothetical protein
MSFTGILVCRYVWEDETVLDSVQGWDNARNFVEKFVSEKGEDDALMGVGLGIGYSIVEFQRGKPKREAMYTMMEGGEVGWTETSSGDTKLMKAWRSFLRGKV